MGSINSGNTPNQYSFGSSLPKKQDGPAPQEQPVAQAAPNPNGPGAPKEALPQALDALAAQRKDQVAAQQAPAAGKTFTTLFPGTPISGLPFAWPVGQKKPVLDALGPIKPREGYYTYIYANNDNPPKTVVVQVIKKQDPTDPAYPSVILNGTILTKISGPPRKTVSDQLDALIGRQNTTTILQKINTGTGNTGSTGTTGSTGSNGTTGPNGSR